MSLLMPRLLLTCLCALALTASGPAQAQGPRVDPDSPAGAEYQLPIDRAREQARERPAPAAGARDAHRGAAAPLFATGVEAQERKRDPRRTGGAKASDRRDRNRSAEPAPKPVPARTPQPNLGTATPELRDQASAPDDGGSGLAAIGGAAFAVVLLGGLAGLAWRRRTVRR
jgi:hypothetical protein